MSNISKIAIPHDVRMTRTQQGVDRMPSSDTRHPQGAKNPKIAKPQGIGVILKEQGNKDLQNSTYSQENMREMVKNLQETLDKTTPEQHTVGFRQDSRTDSYVIEIKDKEGKLVRQFPPEKVLNLYRKMDELSGMVIDEMI